MMLDPKKKMNKVEFMNNIASVVQVLHSDPLVKELEIKIKSGKSYVFKLI